jgi:hypothetical protein
MTERHTPPTSGITFPTKVDVWLLLVIAGALVATLASVYTAYRTDPAEARFALLIGGATWALVAALCVPCDYTLAEDRLIVRGGILRYRIPYADITDIAPSREIWSAPALSLQRVKISYGRFESVLISPRERERFIAELEKRVQAASRV